jgi:2-polyprenyl-3-methyl-5-hydroxy-6-metoxy-1,4-benzoquinol methylase
MGESFDPEQTAEFDRYALSYEELHAAVLAPMGEGTRYFAQYKRGVLEDMLGPGFASPVLDFGCGIGNLTQLLTASFPNVHGYDLSSEATQSAARRTPGARFFHEVEQIPRAHYGAIVLANVLHHVQPAQRSALLASVRDLLLPGGRLVVFEHNPWNPLTRRAVDACPFDENAALLYPSEARRLLRRAGLAEVGVKYIVFFPRLLQMLRPFERRLAWLPLGGQFCAWGVKRGMHARTDARG